MSKLFERSQGELQLSCEFAELVGDCPAIEFHRILLAVTWTVVANIAIFSLLYKRSKLTYYLHSTLMWIVVILTFGGTFSLMGEAGIRLVVEDGARRFTHNLLGLLLLIIVGFLSLLGYTTHYMQESLSVHPKVVATLRKIHVGLGYIMMILGKIIVQIGWWSDKVLFYISLGLQIIILIIWAWKKFYPSLLEHKCSRSDPFFQNSSLYTEGQEQEEKKIIKSISQLYLFPNEYIVFNDHVYQIEQVLTQHPGGTEIIRSCLGREIDRFLYGVQTIEMTPYTFRSSHSVKSLEMLGNPVAKFQRAPMYNGLETSNPCKVDKVTQLPESKVYIVWLSSEEKQFEYRGFQNIETLGQYFTVTLNNKITRLYTSVNFLVESEIEIPRKNPNIQSFQAFISEHPQKIRSQIKSTGLPLLIKKYDSGKFSSQICGQFEGQVLISSNLGNGLALQEKEPGNILIVAGGTGVYPFLDLIDILHKLLIMKEDPEVERKVIHRHPGLRDPRLENFSFDFLVSLKDYHDLPPSIVATIRELLHKRCRNFSITLKLPTNQHRQFLQKVPSIKLTTESFQVQLRKNQKQYSHMYVCGAAVLVDQMVSFWVDEKGIQGQKITII